MAVKQELIEFCLHYHEWKELCFFPPGGFLGVGGMPYALEWKDPTGDLSHISDLAKRSVELIKECCILTSEKRADDILDVVTKGLSPESVGLSEELYERFFEILEYHTYDIFFAS